MTSLRQWLQLRFDFDSPAIRPRCDNWTTYVTTVGLPVCGLLHWFLNKWKKALRDMQTLLAGRSNAEPKIFTLLQTPFPGAQDDQNVISWRWPLPLPTDPVWWKSVHAISSYRGYRLTPCAGPLQTHRQDR